MKKIIILLAILSGTCFAGPGYIVKNATVKKLTSSSGNQEIFRVFYKDGLGDTCDGQVRFFLDKAGSEGSFNRAFDLATLAYNNYTYISIYSFTDNLDCDSAVTIELHKYYTY